MSRRGNNADGTSWATAWNELNAIDWSEISPGDHIVVDGGATACSSNYAFADHSTQRPGLQCGMLYQTPLRIGASGASGDPIHIQLSGASGRNGTAVIFGGRASMLPYCDQQSYSAAGSARAAGVTVPGQSYVVMDGVHLSGFMIYGAQSGVDLASDATNHVTLRNMEIFDNGTFSTWANGYRTDGEGISLVGHDITIDRALIHDNGQDAIQDRYTGPINNDSHAAMYNIRVTNSWLYEHRASPLFPGYGFNSGSQGISSQNCTHVDGLQVWGGGLDQKNLVLSHDVFGPYLAQGVYPGDENAASFDGVQVTNSLFLNILDHAIIGDPIAGHPRAPHDWKIDHVTSYMTGQPAPGLNSHGKVDLAGSGSSVTDSIFYNGYFANDSSFSAESGNVWWGGDSVPGGVNTNPQFVGPLPSGNTPTYDDLTSMNLTAQCAACVGAGASMPSAGRLLHRIRALNKR